MQRSKVVWQQRHAIANGRTYNTYVCTCEYVFKQVDTSANEAKVEKLKSLQFISQKYILIK